MTQIPITPIAQGVGQRGVVVTAAQSLLPGGTPITIPAGFLAVGDIVEIEAKYSKTGNAGTPTVDIQFGGQQLFGGGQGFGTTESGVLVKCLIVIMTLNAQSSFAQLYKVIGALADINMELAVNCANAVNIDIRASDPGATTDTISLQGYRVTVTRAA